MFQIAPPCCCWPRSVTTAQASAAAPRPQPDNIYEFGAQYFGALLEQQRSGTGYGDGPSTSGGALGSVAAAAAGIDVTSLSPAELEPIVMSEYAARLPGGRAGLAGVLVLCS
jgi:hypothetical protein